jgi:N-acetylglutamate synthase-like GNAT family acetyltransferase
MKIRPAQLTDKNAIIELLSQMDYPNTESFIEQKLIYLLNDKSEFIAVMEDEEKVIAFISIHIIPQIATPGDFARISYLSVNNNYRSKGIGKLMEEYCVQVAKENNCQMIELHSNARRTEAHKFYFRQGYKESPKYLIKKV